ncbi:unnamed protein product [Danaus chrysippus]|uniref:(African queen) hypothetical protein n=1 Tax=Danaus chrysippus TaxID=151541 RepID=A0A8J2VTQ0_9NEOP|nr:unnamed protein product [Danaus chrysippus]
MYTTRLPLTPPTNEVSSLFQFDHYSARLPPAWVFACNSRHSLFIQTSVSVSTAESAPYRSSPQESVFSLSLFDLSINQVPWNPSVARSGLHVESPLASWFAAHSFHNNGSVHLNDGLYYTLS